MYDASRYGASGIAADYDEIYAAEWDTDGAVESLALLADGRSMLELGIGTGRLALPLAARGVDVHGIDASQEMVDVLRAKPGGDRIPVTIGDFSEADAGRGFGLVALPANTMFALPDQAAQVRCFANAARHLGVGGTFVVEAWIPDVGAFRENRLVRPRLLSEHLMSIESVAHEPSVQRMRTTQAVFRDGSVRLYPANHRYAWPAELDLMGQLAGFVLAERWADWRGTAFGDTSRTHVSIYRLPPSRADGGESRTGAQ
jgi:SAM-dependent methyltransferase